MGCWCWERRSACYSRFPGSSWVWLRSAQRRAPIHRCWHWRSLARSWGLSIRKTTSHCSPIVHWSAKSW
jgi:hypothetical protein